MIRFNSMAISFGQAWFDEPVSQPMPDIVILRHSKARPAAGPVSLKKSLMNDLTAPEGEIFAKIGKTCRYKIKRAETKDGASCYVDSRPTDRELFDFMDFYLRFARQKGLPPINRNRFSAVNRAERLRLSHAQLGGHTVVRHAYIASGQTVRLLYSASLFRDSDPEMRSAIGRANRLLHWRDMLAFKDEGIRSLDWGGIFADETSPDRKGVNDFKREFGGEEVSYFEGYEAHSPRGRAILKLYSIVTNTVAFAKNIRGDRALPVAN